MNIALFTEARESTRWVKDNGVPPGGSLVPGGIPPFLPPSFLCIAEGGGIRERGITEVLWDHGKACERGTITQLLLHFSTPFLVGVSTINSAWDGSIVSLGDAHRRSTLVQRPGDWVIVLCMDAKVPPVPAMV